jgi:putative ABC transport system substrate-binding protein
MKRREFIAGLGAAAWPIAAWAQQAERLARIGYLGPTSASQLVGAIDAFSNGLRDLGYVEGRNLHIEFRFADGHEDRLPAWRPSWLLSTSLSS